LAKDARMTRHGPLSDDELEEIASFLDVHLHQGGMDLSMFDGFMCALACGPNDIDPREWLPFIWSDEGDQPRVDGDERFERIISLLLGYFDMTVGETREGSFRPLLPNSALLGTANRAQPWCLGFTLGVSLDAQWKQFLEDGEAAMLAAPIFALVDPEKTFEGSAPDPEAMEDLIDLLPQAVAMTRLYWLDAKRSALRGRTSSRSTVRKSKGREPESPSTALGSIHRLKIRLIDVRPPIWRRVEIASDTKLPDVSRALLAVMGWDDSHLHGFRAHGESYGVPDYDFPSTYRDERRVTLAQLAPRPKDHFIFDYDFGDGWEHRVVVEAIADADPEARYPRCLAGKRACPPEDCGGPSGYAELLRQLGDPSDEEHEAMLECAGPIDPEAFSLAEANAELARLAPRRRRGKSNRR
jgi:yecA family protein